MVNTNIDDALKIFAGKKDGQVTYQLPVCKSLVLTPTLSTAAAG